MIIAIFVILLIFGSKSIPELARGLGSGVREFKAGTKEGQLEDKKDEKGKTEENGTEEGVTTEAKTDDEAKLEDDDVTVEAEKAEQKRS